MIRAMELLSVAILATAPLWFSGCAEETLDAPLGDQIGNADYHLDPAHPLRREQNAISADAIQEEQTVEVDDQPPEPPRKTVVGSIFNALKNGAAGAVEEMGSAATE